MNQPPILVAGIGNIFKGDDGFGVEVVGELAKSPLPDGVDVADFGIRGVDLALSITSGYETVILIDALQRGSKPGCVTVIQPSPADLRGPAPAMQGHNLDPLSVLRWASRMTDSLPDVYVVGCEPAEIPDGDALAEGLSPTMQEAVPEAADLARTLIVQHGQAAPTLHE